MLKTNAHSAPAVLTLLLAVLFWVYSHFDPAPPSGILASHVKVFGQQSSLLQFVTYIVVVAGFFIALANRNPVPRGKEPVPGPYFGDDSPQVASALVFLFVLFLVGSYGDGYAATALGAILLVLLATRWRTPSAPTMSTLTLLSALAAVIYLAVYVVYPFATPPIIHTLEYGIAVDSHYAMSVGPAQAYATGQHQGDLLTRLNYGLSMFLLAGYGHKTLAFLAGQHAELMFTVVRLYQVLAIALLAFSAYLLNRRHVVLVASLLVILTPSLNTLGQAVYYPNQSGLRYIPFILGLLALTIAYRKRYTSTIGLGLLGGFFVAMAMDSGLALVAGFVVFGYLSRGDTHRSLGSAASHLVRYLLVALPTFLLVSLALDRSLGLSPGSDNFDFLAQFSAGYGGITDRLAVPAALVTFLCMHVLLRGFTRRHDGRAALTGSYQAAVATIALVWLAYYVNRMADWNLWFQAVLLVFMYGPLMNRHTLRTLLIYDSVRTPFGLVLVTTIGLLLASAVNMLIDDFAQYRGLRLAHCESALTLTPDKCYPESHPRSAENALERLDGLDRSGHLVLGPLPGKTRDMGFNQRFPWYEPFGEIMTIRSRNDAVRWISQSGPQTILLYTGKGDPDFAESLRKQIAHQRELIVLSERYRAAQEDPPWLAFERQADP